jgi:site-specific recombinase XerD
MTSFRVHNVLLLEATGFRLMEILMLELDCLIENSTGYWLKSERVNSKFQNPMIPISKDVYQVIVAQRNLIQEKFPNDKNPKNLLLLSQSKKSYGKPYMQLTVLRAFDRFAERANIRDEQGNLYHFTVYAFKHRFGVNLMNAGLSMVQVYQLLANVTLDSTMIYSNITNKLQQRN